MPGTVRQLKFLKAYPPRVSHKFYRTLPSCRIRRCYSVMTKLVIKNNFVRIKLLHGAALGLNHKMVGVRWCRTSENPKVIRKIVMTAKLLKMNRLKIILKGKLEA